MSIKETGTIKFFNNTKGYGFALNSAGEDGFVHYREIVGTGFKTLSTGQQIQFAQVRSEKGWQATQVEVLETV